MEKDINKDLINQLERTDLLEDFWKNLDDYIEKDTVIEEIDNTFPHFFVENYKIYQELFNHVSNFYNEYYIKNIDVDIDFTIKYSDAFRYIVDELKNTYKKNKNIYSADLEEIISSMYHDKYLEHLKNKGVGKIVSTLRAIKYFC